MSADERQRLLADLGLVFQYPYLLEQCSRKTKAETLRGLGKWMRSGRRCKICKRRIPPEREKCCSKRCARTLQRGRRDAVRRKRGIPVYTDFKNAVKVRVGIDAIAAKKEISIEQVRALAEADVRAGRLKAWRNAAGEITEIGAPK